MVIVFIEFTVNLLKFFRLLISTKNIRQVIVKNVINLKYNMQKMSKTICRNLNAK